MDEEDWLGEYMKPFDQSSEGTEEDRDKEEEATEKEEPKGTKEGGQEEHEEEAAGEQEGRPEEARKAKGTKAFTKPSNDEVDEHMLTHLPFRSWCPHCVRGKSKGKPHKRKDEEEGTTHSGTGLHVHA